MPASSGFGGYPQRLMGGSAIPLDLVSNWIRLADSTVSPSPLFSALVDVLNPGNPAVQAVNGNKGTRALSANGLPIMQCSTTFYQFPLVNSTNNNSPNMGFAYWMRSPSVAANRFMWTALTGAGVSSANRTNNIVAADASVIFDVYWNNATARRARSGPIIPNNAWRFVCQSYEGAQPAPDSNIFKYTLNAVDIPMTFSDVLGAPGAMPPTLVQPTGNAVMFASNTLASNPFTGDIGPNIFLLKRHPTAGELAALMNFEAPT